MRKDTTLKATTKEVRNISGYHSGGGRQSYAFAGFRENKCYTSDRFIRLDENFNRVDGKPLKAYGIEHEFESFAINGENIVTEVFDKLIASLFPADLFKYQRDGSLREDASCEAITQPMTKEFIRNHYPEYKIMFDTYFKALGFSSHRSGRCGMHINISNANFGATSETQDTAVRKLFYIINTHFTFFCDALKRNRDNTGYCGRMSGVSRARTLDLHSFGSDHFVCLNLGHYDAGRVEIRLAGGPANFAAFRNTMETVFCVVDAVKRVSWTDCNSLPAIFKGCNRYVLDRLADCVAAGSLSETDYIKIRETADTETRYI